MVVLRLQSLHLRLKDLVQKCFRNLILCWNIIALKLNFYFVTLGCAKLSLMYSIYSFKKVNGRKAFLPGKLPVF